MHCKGARLMAGKLGRTLAVTAAAVLAAATSGCGSIPPCETDIAAVEAARGVAAAAEAKVAEAEKTKLELEEELAAEEARRAELEGRKADLEARLQELTK
jgi:hypothetical protein